MDASEIARFLNAKSQHEASERQRQADAEHADNVRYVEAYLSTRLRQMIMAAATCGDLNPWELFEGEIRKGGRMSGVSWEPVDTFKTWSLFEWGVHAFKPIPEGISLEYSPDMIASFSGDIATGAIYIDIHYVVNRSTYDSYETVLDERIRALIRSRTPTVTTDARTEELQRVTYRMLRHITPTANFRMPGEPKKKRGWWN